MAKSKLWEDLSPLEKDRASKQYADIYGVNRDDFQEEDRGSQGNFDQKGYEEAISRAANNHYDTRRSVEAARLAGAEGASDLAKGISNMQELRDSFGFLEDHHKSTGGNRFSSRNDFANVTKSFVDMDRKNFTNKMEDSFASYADQNGQQNEQQTTQIPDGKLEDTKQYEYFEQFQRDPSEFDVFGAAPKNQITVEGDKGEVTTAGDSGEQQQKAALDFADKYKIDLVKGLNLKPTIS